MFSSAHIQKGHCINDKSRMLSDHISWWNMFFPNALPEQICWFPHRTITVGKRTWQYPNRCSSSTLHAQKQLICFYKNLPLSGFHPTAHLHITECFNFCLRYPILEYQGWLFWICSVFRKWPVDIFSLCLGMYEVISKISRCSRCSEETSSKGLMQDNRLTQLFSYRFLSILGGSSSAWTNTDVWT